MLSLCALWQVPSTIKKTLQSKGEPSVLSAAVMTNDWLFCLHNLKFTLEDMISSIKEIYI
jgi:hypothetical protein